MTDGDPLLSSSLSVMERAKAAVVAGSSDGQKSSESVSVFPLSSSTPDEWDFFAVKELYKLVKEIL